MTRMLPNRCLPLHNRKPAHFFLLLVAMTVALEASAYPPLAWSVTWWEHNIIAPFRKSVNELLKILILIVSGLEVLKELLNEHPFSRRRAAFRLVVLLGAASIAILFNIAFMLNSLPLQEWVLAITIDITCVLGALIVLKTRVSLTRELADIILAVFDELKQILPYQKRL